MIKVVITYGTFDLFHIGHLQILKRARMLGDRLYVGISTDEFNITKGKRCVIPFEQRLSIVAEMKCVDGCFPESSWDQKKDDIIRYNAKVFVMGSDWQGKFDFLGEICDVIYLDRTPDVSTTEIKSMLKYLEADNINKLIETLRSAQTIAENLK